MSQILSHNQNDSTPDLCLDILVHSVNLKLINAQQLFDSKYGQTSIGYIPMAVGLVGDGTISLQFAFMTGSKWTVGFPNFT